MVVGEGRGERKRERTRAQRKGENTSMMGRDIVRYDTQGIYNWRTTMVSIA